MKKWYYYCRKCKRMHEVHSKIGQKHEKKYGFRRVTFRVEENSKREKEG